MKNSNNTQTNPKGYSQKQLNRLARAFDKRTQEMKNGTYKRGPGFLQPYLTK